MIAFIPITPGVQYHDVADSEAIVESPLILVPSDAPDMGGWEGGIFGGCSVWVLWDEDPGGGSSRFSWSPFSNFHVFDFSLNFLSFKSALSSKIGVTSSRPIFLKSQVKVSTSQVNVFFCALWALSLAHNGKLMKKLRPSQMENGITTNIGWPRSTRMSWV